MAIRLTLRAVVWLGRLVGTTTFEPLANWLGYKRLVVGVGCLQVLAVISRFRVPIEDQITEWLWDSSNVDNVRPPLAERWSLIERSETG